MQTLATLINCFSGKMPNVVADLWSIQLAIIGIAVSVMALLFASHVGKVEAHRHISKSKEINNELMSIILSNGINAYRQLNGKIVTIFIFSSLLFLYSCVVKYVDCKDVLLWLGLADLLLTIGLIVWTFLVILGVVSQFKEEVK